VSLKYDDFDLQIERAGEKYRVRLLNAPTGQATGEFVLPFSDVELGNFLSRIGQVRRSMRRVDAPELHAAKEFGGKLFSAVFSGEMIAQLRGSVEQSLNSDHGLRIRLRLTDVPELSDLPWEFLYDASQNHFLTTSTETPVVRFLDLPQRIAPLRATLPLRLLVMIAGPRNLKRLDAEGEWERLQDALDDLVKGGHLVLERLPSATLDALRLRARGAPFHIFHFIGHGGFDSIAEDGVLQFEDESGMSYPVRGEMLGMQLHDHRSLRLAVLNACEGARSSRQDPFSGVAQSLLQQRVPAVIAMQFEISDIAAKVFAREFYRAIAEGNPVDAAVCESRKALFKEEYGQEWATPVLYMRSQEGLLFDLQPGGAVEIGSGRHAAAEADRQSGERAAAEAAAVAEKARQDRAAQEDAARQAETARQAEATRQAETARQAEATRQAKAAQEAVRLAAEKAVAASARSVPETVVVRPGAIDAGDQAAALIGTTPTPQSKHLEPTVRRTSVSTAAPKNSAQGAAAQSPPRLHLPAWQVLLMAVPLVALVLALSWHHLRGHDDDHAPVSQASAAPSTTPGTASAASVAPTATKEPDASPAKPAAALKKDSGEPHSAPVPSSAEGKEKHRDEAAAPSAQPPAHEPKKAQSAPVAPKRIQMDGGELMAKLVSRVQPAYPMAARQANIQGIVRLRIIVNKDGTVQTLNPISGDSLLVQPSTDAVKQWRYAPTLVNGAPVEVESTVEVNYKLNPEPPAAAPCKLGKVDLKDQGTLLIGTVPYTYSGSYSLQTVAVRGVPLDANKHPIAGTTMAQSTLQSADGTASFSIESHPSLDHASTDGEYVLVEIALKSTGEVVCGEIVPYKHKW